MPRWTRTRVRHAHVTVFQQPVVGGAAPVADAEAFGDGLLVALAVGVAVRVQREIEDLFLLRAEHGQHAVRLQLAERLGEVEVVRVLPALVLLALPHLGPQHALGPHPLAEGADEVGVFGEPLDEDRAGAVQGRLHVGDGVAEIVAGRRGRVVVRGGEQQVREGLQAVLAGDLRLGPALGLVGQVQVLKAGLGVGGVDPFRELVGELPLLRDRRQDRGAPLLELAQVAQALLQRSELGVVQRAGGFLAVPRDERNSGAAVEQLDGGGDLAVADAEFRGDPPDHSGLSHGCEPSGRGRRQ